jgi:hypothetical protein
MGLGGSFGGVITDWYILISVICYLHLKLNVLFKARLEMGIPTPDTALHNLVCAGHLQFNICYTRKSLRP